MKKRWSEWNAIPEENIFIGNGSDEIIDLLYRLIAIPGVDEAAAFVPTYGMYGVCAKINDIAFHELPMDDDFQPILPEKSFWKNANLKLVFLCSPNNPVGNDISEFAILEILENFSGLVVVDEAYIHFSSYESWSKRIEQYPNLVVLQTLSKAFGLANLRLGILMGNTSLIHWLNKIKPPYNVNGESQRLACEKLKLGKALFSAEIESMCNERDKLKKTLDELGVATFIGGDSANFLLYLFPNAEELYTQLIHQKILIRRRKEIDVNALRLSIGTNKENTVLITEIKRFYQ